MKQYSVDLNEQDILWLNVLQPNSSGNVKGAEWVTLSPPATLTQVRRAAIKRMPEVLACYPVTGDYDCCLNVVRHNRQALPHFLMDRLTPLPCVGRIQTRVVLGQPKSTTTLPLFTPDGSR